jgi:hypothetical protein
MGVSGFLHSRLRATTLATLPELGSIWGIARQPLDSYFLEFAYFEVFSMDIDQFACILPN